MVNKFLKLFQNRILQYILVVLYGLTMAYIMAGPQNIYGSKTDWCSQHTVFPDIFREHFYQTGDVLPKFLFNIGAGQNAFNFVYYGFLSPFIILSYFFPFMDMMTYIMILSVVLFILTGVLTKKFIAAHYGEGMGFIAAIIILSMAPLNLHFHRHIMFVWYFPLLILGLIGLDRYFSKKKSGLFIVSTFLLIFTNYLYAVPCLFCLYTYAVYKILNEVETEFSWKLFLKKVFTCTYIFAIPILMSGILLAPTAQSLFANSRPSENTVDFADIIIPRIKEYFYDCYSIGITFTMFVATVGNLTCKTLKKSERFLSLVLLSLILFPIITYAFNGFLYVRGKILIPFAVLYIYNLFIFLKNLQTRQIKFFPVVIITGLFGILLCIYYKENGTYYNAILQELVVLCLLSKKPKYIMLYAIIPLLNASIPTCESDITKQYISNIHYDESYSLVESIDYDGFFRTNIAYEEYENANRLYGEKHYNTSVFTSTPNALYLNFYNDNMGNNTYHDCNLVTAGANNELFHSFMGTRYIIAPSDPGFLYEKIKDGKNLNLYENKSCYPVAYKSNSIMSESVFDETRFPYSLAYLMNNTIIDGDFVCDYTPEFEQIEVASEYAFTNDSETEYQIDLGESYVGKYLYLTFEVDNEGEYKNKSNLYITINNSRNTLSKYGYTYYNANNDFEYVIALEDDAVLDIQVSNGKFNVKNLKMYTSDMIFHQYDAVKDFRINKRDDSFSCSVEAEDGEYLVTSIPYDSNFKAFINGKEAEVILVNKAFMGLKLQNGNNDIEFRYDSPFFSVGCIMSLVGLLLFVISLSYKKVKEKLIKYRRCKNNE